MANNLCLAYLNSIYKCIRPNNSRIDIKAKYDISMTKNYFSHINILHLRLIIYSSSLLIFFLNHLTDYFCKFFDICIFSFLSLEEILFFMANLHIYINKLLLPEFFFSSFFNIYSHAEIGSFHLPIHSRDAHRKFFSDDPFWN